MSVLIEKPSPSTIPVRCLESTGLGAALAAAPAANG